MLQEENESILEKVCFSKSEEILSCFLWHCATLFNFVIQLRLAEERREEAEARARELEKQVT